MSLGRFITIEGGEGVGKSTNMDFLQRTLEDHGLDVLRTREPGGTPLAEQLRSLLLAERDETVQPVAETLMIFAARAQHVSGVIEPALAAGRWVICERFTDSTFAYQVGGRGLDESMVEHLAEWVHPGRWPDLTLYLDAPVDAAMGRIANRDLDRFERQQSSFFERVRAVYLQRLGEHARIQSIDASRDPVSVQGQIRAAVERFLVSA